MGIWEVFIQSTSLGLHFSADLDDDGDENVAAAGDRPMGVHPREVLLADLDGEGSQD